MVTGYLDDGPGELAGPGRRPDPVTRVLRHRRAPRLRRRIEVESHADRRAGARGAVGCGTCRPRRRAPRARAARGSGGARSGCCSARTCPTRTTGSSCRPPTVDDVGPPRSRRSCTRPRRLDPSLHRLQRRARHGVAARGRRGRSSTSRRWRGNSHHLGTARMGDDPATSVVDRWCMTHDVPNLGIVDGSVFVTAGAVNPTSTIGALALPRRRPPASNGAPTCDPEPCRRTSRSPCPSRPRP